MFLRFSVFLICIVMSCAPSFAKGKKLLVLVPGASGAVPIDFVVRNERRFRKAGFKTRIAVYPGEIKSAVQSARSSGKRVVIVAMSKGGVHTAKALANGTKPHGVAFVATAYRKIMRILGSPAKLPKTIVVHHRDDACRKTPARAAFRLQKWARGKVRVRLIKSTGHAVGRDCGARGAHGFYRKDGAAVAAIVSFARSR